MLRSGIFFLNWFEIVSRHKEKDENCENMIVFCRMKKAKGIGNQEKESE